MDARTHPRRGRTAHRSRRHRIGRAVGVAAVVAAVVAGSLLPSLAGVAAGALPEVGAPAPAARASTGAVRYLDRVFDDVDLTRDVAYGAVGDAVRVLDVYEPAGDTETERPVIIWMHGAGPASNDKAHPVDAYINTAFARHGVVTMSINYVDAATDAATAIAWMHMHADEYRIDTDRVVVAGVSAGAIGATRLAYESGDDPPVDAVVAYAGVSAGYDFAAGDPPVFIVHGTNDEAVPVERVRDFCAVANAAGVGCELTEYPTDHAGIFAHAEEIEALTAAWLYETLELATPDTTPDDTLPDDTLPDDTLPDDTLPDDTLPDDTLPEEPTSTTEPPLVVETPRRVQETPICLNTLPPVTTPRFAG